MNFMKPMLSLLLTAAAALTLSFCGHTSATEEQETVKLAVSQTSFSIDAAASSLEFTVTSSKSPSVVSRDSWLTRSIGAFSANKSTVKVTAEANTSTEERTGSLKVICGDENISVSVTQKGCDPPEEVNPCPDVKPLDNDAYAMAKKLGMGWNLGNQMDAHANGVANETCWGNKKATQATFDGVKAKGFASVRIPVTWLGHIGEAPDYKIDEAWMDRVAEIVGYAHNAGLNAIINIHHDGADSEHWLDIKSAASDDAKQQSILAEIKAVWGQIAAKFKDSGDFLMFESFNEIHDGKWGWGDNLTDGGKQYNCLNQWNQAFVDVVRAAGGQNTSRYLIVPGYCADPTLTVKSFVLPNDSASGKLIVAVHCYEPYAYTLSAEFSEWGHTGSADKKPSSDETNIIELYSMLYDAYTSKNIPVVIGETGCSNRASARELSFRNYYFEFTWKAAGSYGLAPFLWDNGATGTGQEAGGFLDHSTGEYITNGKAAIEAMKKAVLTEDDNYTLKKIYSNAP